MPPASANPPEDQASVRQFDPLAFDRAIIALPLLQEMQKDLEGIAQLKGVMPDAERDFNSAIEYNPGYPGGLEAAREEVVRMTRAAAERAVKTAETRLPFATGEGKEIQAQQTAELVAVKDQQTIGPIIGDGPFGLANLHASVIRRLVSVNESLERGAPMRFFHIFPNRFEIIIDLNLRHPGGREAARKWVNDNLEKAKELAGVRDGGQKIHWSKDLKDGQYVFARLEARAIKKLVELDVEQAKAAPKGKSADSRAIYHIWPDFEISACINRSVSTVKADAAQNSFSAFGTGITWAVMDSGINKDHPHFKKYGNIDPDSRFHRDFTTDGGGPFDDENGHGTHVAGIIAGEWRSAPDAPPETRPLAVSRFRKQDTEDVEYQETRLESISGMAPRCRLVSLRVLDENGKGSVSNLIAAIGHIQEINGYGRRLLIHGVNMSVGYNFEPEWFACGHSPLCVEVDRLVKSGVVVVVAAGNSGYGALKAESGTTSAGMALTINDPGNADLAITVGSTHRDMPHVYGVSYFSSKGPTGDGRLKPDLVAPGEKIISCAQGRLKESGAAGKPCDYVETSGTSMAAPHVSGAIAAFLSIRGEYIGEALKVKEIFTSSATDLKRDRYFQGAGLVDLMRAIQSV